MKAQFAILLVLLLPFSSVSAKVDGVFVGNGGHSIVCFDQNLAQEHIDYFIENGVLMSTASAWVKFINTLDYYVAKRMRNIPVHKLDDTDLADFEGLSFEEVRNKVYKRFSVLKGKEQQMFQCVREKLGLFTDGIRADKGLVSTADSSLALEIPNRCRILQVVVRQGAVFTYNPRNLYWIELSSRSRVDQVAIMQLHEEFYAFAAEAYGHKDSAMARNLLATLLASVPTEKQLKNQLSYFGAVQKNPCGE